jgi:anti-sigma factor RsiW
MQPKAAMRHIPEEELHAYLDQGLSRSQCVEIESHLAACPACQSERDSIAALRDRTTALLAKLAPPRGFPPAFEALHRRAQAQASAHRRRVQIGAWAASLVLAVGLGWTANYLIMKPQTPVTVSTPASSPSVASVPSTPLPRTPVATRAVLRQASKSPQRSGDASQGHAAAKPVSAAVESLPPVVPAPTLELTSVNIPRSETELDGMWRTLSWDGAQAEAGDQVPHIDGLPVVQVQLQAVEQGKQPLMVVAQQLSSGEVIRTIEGPMSDVSHLLAGKTISNPDSSARSVIAGADSSRRVPAPDHTDRTMAMQRGDRMLVITGALPSDSLLAMIRRLNAEMRSK